MLHAVVMADVRLSRRAATADMRRRAAAHHSETNRTTRRSTARVWGAQQAAYARWMGVIGCMTRSRQKGCAQHACSGDVAHFFGCNTEFSDITRNNIVYFDTHAKQLRTYTQCVWCVFRLHPITLHAVHKKSMQTFFLYGDEQHHQGAKRSGASAREWPVWPSGRSAEGRMSFNDSRQLKLADTGTCLE